jgi:RNA polymerase sigma factor (sigma-70 family)
MDDFELLKDYADRGSQPAFRQLVERHVDLVYAAARRQLRSPELAQEVTQGVFVELALQARKLRPGQPLGAWLHVVTRRRAIDALRRESRRQQRELAAVQIAAVDAPSFKWPSIEPLLDEAIASLDEGDRNAVVLRYLENKSLREVGQAIGASEDAAQKRVGRALERLREFFGRRGITATAAGLAAEISSHAVEAAPMGLAAAIFPVAVGSAPATSLVPHLLMTSAQKILITAGLVAAIGTAWYQHNLIVRKDARIAALESQADALHREIHRLSIQVAQASALAVKARSESSSDQTAEGVSPELRALLSRVAQLKERLQRDPSRRTPEMQYLNEADWISEVAKKQLETDNDFRRALADLRGTAAQKFMDLVRPALRAYLKASQGQLPPDTAALASYANPPLDPAVLQRYNMLQTGNVSDAPRSAMLIGTNPDLLVDPDFDGVVQSGTNGVTMTNLLGNATAAARAAFRQANNGQEAQDPSQLVPYFKSPDLAKQFLDRSQRQQSQGTLQYIGSR